MINVNDPICSDLFSCRARALLTAVKTSMLFHFSLKNHIVLEIEAVSRHFRVQNRAFPLKFSSYAGRDDPRTNRVA